MKQEELIVKVKVDTKSVDKALKEIKKIQRKVFFKIIGRTFWELLYTFAILSSLISSWLCVRAQEFNGAIYYLLLAFVLMYIRTPRKGEQHEIDINVQDMVSTEIVSEDINA